MYLAPIRLCNDDSNRASARRDPPLAAPLAGLVSEFDIARKTLEHLCDPVAPER